MDSYEIAVNPDELRKYAEDIGGCRQTFRTSLSNSESQIASLKSVWTGAAAETFNESFKQLVAKCEEGLDTLSRMEHALYDSADAYDSNERAVQEEGAKLPTLPNNTMR